MPERPRILVTRAPHQASELADRIRALGADPILIPTIALEAPTSFDSLDTALADLSPFDWLLFTSANAVEAFAQRLAFLGGRLPEPQRYRIAAIGAATARSLHTIGLQVDLIPPRAIAESLTEALLPHARSQDGTPTRFLLIRAESARDHLPESLIAAGAEVVLAPAYRTVTPAGSIDQLRQLFTLGPPDAVTFTSSSSARNLLELLAEAGLNLPETVTRASIGPVTSATLRDLGYPPHLEAEEATVASLAEKTVGHVCGEVSPLYRSK
jgi:uroporphyrinogen-III synthase